jgi:predicted lipoprotein with Yx(FWY)xxD motif
MTRTRAAALLATVAAALALTSACGQNSAKPAAASRSDTGTVRLVAATVGSLGTVVTDRKGYTLYRWDKDKPSVSNCTGSCATSWPPVIAGTGEIELQGVDRALVGTITRPDGTRQVTLNEWPLYRFANDTAPGEANGQGSGGTWFAATPEGKKATATPTAAATATADSGGYGY